MNFKKSISAVTTSLKTCSYPKDIQRVKTLHAASVRSGDESNLYLASALVSSYSRCDGLWNARQVFDQISGCDLVCWNALLLGLAENGEAEKALHLFHNMKEEGCVPDPRTYVAALKACRSLAEEEHGDYVGGKFVKLVSLSKGMAFHSRTFRSGCSSDVFVCNTLIDMYSKCGSVHGARTVFDLMPRCDVVSWTALVMGYAENGEEELGLQVFSGMLQTHGFLANALTFVAALKACTGLAVKEEGRRVDGKMVKWRSLESGMDIHSKAFEFGCESEPLVVNTLVDMYSRCRSLFDARVVFDRTLHWSVVSWTALLAGCADNGEAEVALQLFARMNIEPNSRTFVAALKACSCLAASETGEEVGGKVVKTDSLEKGMRVHSQAVDRGCDSDTFVANTLVDMYASCGSLEQAFAVFSSMSRRTVVTWNVLITGCVENGGPELGLRLFFQAQRAKDFTPDALTFVAALKACSSLSSAGRMVKAEVLHRGIEIHMQASRHNVEGDILVANTLIDMYAKCGSMAEGRRVFDRICSPTLVSWTVLILGYAENGEGDLALEAFHRMNLQPDAVVFAAACKACASLAMKEQGREVAKGRYVKEKALEEGLKIHGQALEAGYGEDLLLSNVLVDMYCKCGSLANARAVFYATLLRNVVSYNSLILGYADNGEEDLALQLYDAMIAEKACIPDTRTFVAALKACTCLAVAEQAKEHGGRLVKVNSLGRGIRIHSEAARHKCDCDTFVANILVDMYSKCGCLEDARKVFNKMARPDVVSWTSLILGYTENGEVKGGLDVFELMQAQGCVPNGLTLAAVMKGCGIMADLKTGKEAHGEACRFGLENDAVVESSLVDLYGKLARRLDAQLVFDASLNKSKVSWNALLASYSRQGDSEQVFHWFHRMEEEGVEVDGITLVSVLAACSHGGLVDKGKKCFEEMEPRYGIVPSVEHYHCMVDLLARANCLMNAVEVVKRMPTQGDQVAWMTVLSACSKWQNVTVANLAFEHLHKFESMDSSAFVLMSNILQQGTTNLVK